MTCWADPIIVSSTLSVYAVTTDSTWSGETVSTLTGLSNAWGANSVPASASGWTAVSGASLTKSGANSAPAYIRTTVASYGVKVGTEVCLPSSAGARDAAQADAGASSNGTDLASALSTLSSLDTVTGQTKADTTALKADTATLKSAATSNAAAVALVKTDTAAILAAGTGGGGGVTCGTTTATACAVALDPDVVGALGAVGLVAVALIAALVARTVRR